MPSPSSTRTYRFNLAVRLVALLCTLGFFAYAWYVGQQAVMDFVTRRRGNVTLSGGQLDQYAVWLVICGLLPLSVWFRSQTALRWYLVAWFCSLMAALFVFVLGPVL